MQIRGTTALVTGANRGIGAAEFVNRLRARGATRIYAASRGGDVPAGDGVVPVRLDVTDPAQAGAAAELASDVDLVVNNAGISTGTLLVTGDLGAVRREMETNFFGALHVIRAFAPVLAARGGGSVVNVLSALSWFTAPGAGSYAASKAAAWSLTDAVRQELTGPGTHVVGVHMGLVDTDMSAAMDAPKLRPVELADAALDAVESGTQEVLADDWARAVKAGLSLPPAERYRQLFGS